MARSEYQLEVEGSIQFLEQLKGMVNIGLPKNDLKTIINQRIITQKNKL